MLISQSFSFCYLYGTLNLKLRQVEVPTYSNTSAHGLFCKSEQNMLMARNL